MRKVEFDPDEVVDDERIETLRVILQEEASQADILVLDLGYRPIGRSTHWITTAEALHALSAAFLGGGHSLLVLTDSCPPASNALMRLLLSESWRPYVQVVDTNGVFVARESGWPIPDDAALACTQSATDRQDALRRRLLRLRGVFRHPSKSGGRYTRFRYTGEFASAHLRVLLSRHLEDRHPDFVVVERDASEWFRDALARACLEANVPLVVVEEGLLIAHGTDLPVSEALSSTRHPQVLVAVPVYRNGDTCRRLQELIQRHVPEANTQFLAVFAQTGTPGTATATDFGFIRSVRTSGNTVPLHFVTPIPNSTLPKTGWLVRAAQRLNEVIDPPHEWVDPTRTAMWDLFDRYGFSEEYARQESRTEHVAHFPLLNDMEEEDAKWLAYSMLRRAGLDGEDTLVVMPQDESGTVLLERAYEESLDVAAIRIRRELVAATKSPDAITGVERDELTRVINKLEEYSDGHVLLIDESSMGGNTIQSFTDFISEFTREPEAAIVAVAARIGKPDEGPLSLYSWNVNDVSTD